MATSITLQVGAEYIAGTTVSVYNTVNSVPIAPVGSVVTTGTVGSDGTVTFLGLTVDKNYLAYAVSGTPQYVRFYVPAVTPSAAGSGVPTGGTTGQVLAKASSVDGDAAWGTTAALSNAVPLAPGTPVSGTDPNAARADHVHAPPDVWLPSSQGFLAWTHDPAVGAASTTLFAGYLQGGRMALRRPVTAANITIYIGVAGVTLTGCGVGLYKLDGTLIAKTADQSSVWTSTGLKTMALTAEAGQSLDLPAADVMFACNVATAGTQPQATSSPSSGLTAALTNAGVASQQYRGFAKGTSFTSLPSALPGALAPNANWIWASLS